MEDLPAADAPLPNLGRFKEDLPEADAPLPSQGHFQEDLPAVDKDGMHNIDIGLCIFAPRVAKEIGRGDVFQVERIRSGREIQTEQRHGQKGRTLSQEQMPPPPRPSDVQPSRINKGRRLNDESHSESTAFSKTNVAIAPGPQGPRLSRTNREPDSQVKSSRYRRIQAQVRRNLGLNQTASRDDESNHAEDLPESSTAWLPGLVELCNAAYINMLLKDPCPSMIAQVQRPGLPPDQSLRSTPLDSRAARMQPFGDSSPGQQSYTARHQRRKRRTASSIPQSPSPLPEAASVSTQEKTFFLDELLHFYQVRELHTINTGPATLYSCATHDAKVQGATLACPSFILLHAAKKYPEWPSLFFSSTQDTEEEFGCIHSLPRVHKDKQLDAVPVFKEVTWLIREVSANAPKESDREKGSNPTTTGSVSEGAVPLSQNPESSRSTISGNRAKTAKKSKNLYPVLSEDSNEITSGLDLHKACHEHFLEGRRATFLGWYDILGVRYHQRRPQALHDKLQRMLPTFRTGVRVHPVDKGSTTQQVSAKVAENYKCLFRFKDEVWKEDQMPPEGPTADANPIERSFAATPERMSPWPRPCTWDPLRPEHRAKVFELSKTLEACASAQSAPPPTPSSHRQSGEPVPPIPFTAHIEEKDYWTLILGEAFVNVTLAPASPKSLGRVVDMHSEEALTDPLTLRYKRSITVAEDGLSCEIEGTDVPDGDAVYDTLGRRFEKACAVRSDDSDGPSGGKVKGGSSPKSDTKVRANREDFSNPYAGTEYRRRRDIKKRWPRSWGQEDDCNGGDDETSHVALEESAANANAFENAEDHHGDDDDNDEPDDFAGQEDSIPTDTAENPVPAHFKYRPSMSFTVPTRETSPGNEALGVMKVQRIVRQACDLDLQHIREVLRGMCRQQFHHKQVEGYATQRRGAMRQTERQLQRQEKQQLGFLRGMMASGQVEANWTGVLEATDRWNARLPRKSSWDIPGEGLRSKADQGN